MSNVQIEHSQLLRPARRIGDTNENEDVYEHCLKGGLVVLEARKRDSGAKRTLGMGPHRGLARFIAKKRLGDKMRITELSKSEMLPPEYWLDRVPEFETLTDRMNEARKG